MDKKSNLKKILSSINSDEDFEQFKLIVVNSENLAREIIDQLQLPEAPILFLEGTNIVFSHGNKRIIKIFPPFHKEHFRHEVLVLRHLYNKLSISIPKIECEGEIESWPFMVMSRLDDILLEGLWEQIDHNNKKILISELGLLIREVHSKPTDGLETIDCHWEQFINKQKMQCLENHRARNLSESLLLELPKYLESINEILPKIKNPVILTGEYTPMNLLVKNISGIWHISGMIDFGDSMLGLPEYDLLGPGAFLIQGDKHLLKEFLTAYGYSPDSLTQNLSHQLTILMLLHRYSNLNIQIRIKNWKNKVKNLNDLENLVWGF